MDKYYYLVAQLPILFFDQAPPLGINGFLSESEKWMSGRDYALLVQVDMNQSEAPDGAPGVLDDYMTFETHLRSELALWRRSRGTEQEYRPMGFALATVREGTPLEIEKRLLRLRWDYLEEEAHAHHFDLGFLILYFLKLQILRRLSTFDKEEGLKTFQNLCEVDV